MGRFENSALAGVVREQAAQRAAPVGLRNYAAQMGAAQSRIRDTALGQTVQEQGYTPVAQSWYTGANPNGTGNGWDTQFVDDFMRGQKQAASRGDMNTYFQRPDATGVVTWDHKSTDGTQTYRFGDVFRQGKRDGNVYDQFDKPTANLMMADWLFDRTTKTKIFQGDNPTGDIDREVTAARTRNATEIPKALSAQSFQARTDATEKRFSEGHVDEAIVGGTTAGGAALGAGIGAAVFGVPTAGVLALPGALIGGGIGAIAGFAGGLMNQDALTEQAARAYEITSESNRTNNTAAAWATGISQWAGFSGRLISPISNLYQGNYDRSRGDVGDGTSEYFKLDKSGHTQVSKLARAIDVVGAIGDSALQFASPVGAMLYMAQMGGTITGEVGELALTGGKSFDYARGGFDNIFTDDKGDFSPLRAAAGIGKVGIDAVQMGMARGILSKTQSARVAVGEGLVGASGPGILGRMGSRIYGGGKGGVQKEELAGFKFGRNAAGERTMKPSLSLLAPSEQLTALSARLIAARAVARKEGGFDADDFYRAAQSLASGTSAGGSRMKGLLVNGMGEAYEEGVQAVLDPYSHQSRISGEEIFSAAAYGFAGGVGMSGGAALRTPSAATRMASLAKANFELRNGAPLSDEAYNAMPSAQQKALAAQTPVERGLTKAAHEKIVRDGAAKLTANVEGVYKLADSGRAILASEAAKATISTDQSFVIHPFEDPGETNGQGELTPSSMPADGVGSSGLQLMKNLVNRLRATAGIMATLERDKAKDDATLAANPSDPAAQSKAAQTDAHIAQTELILSWGQYLTRELDFRIGRMYGRPPDQRRNLPAYEPTLSEVEAEATSTNQWLRDAFNRKINTAIISVEGVDTAVTLTDEDKMAMARAISQVVTRYPNDSGGSFQVLVPQASAQLTHSNSDNVLQIGFGLIPALRADYDGDKVSTLQQLILDDETFITLRTGAQSLGAGTSINVKAPTYEQWIFEELAESLTGADGALKNAATATLTEIGKAIRNRYAGFIETDVLDPILDRFFETATAGASPEPGAPNARQVLLDGLGINAGGPITTFARGNLSNEQMWIDQLVRATTSTFQKIYASHAPDLSVPLNTNLVVPLQQSDDVKERRAEKAATTGISMGLVLAGETLFRMFQAMHYNVLSAAVRSASTVQGRQHIYDMAATLEALGSGITRSALDEVRGKDDITARVYLQLLKLAQDAKKDRPDLNTIEAVVLVANMGVLDFDIDDKNNIVTKGRQVTLAQLLLKQSVAQDRREKDIIFDATPELQIKHKRLLAMTKPSVQGSDGSSPVNAQRAFVEVLGSQQLATLLGADAHVFGAQLTIEQFLRHYISLHERDRNTNDNKMKGEAAYLGRKETHNIPYGPDEIASGKVSAYRSVVDSIIAVGHNRITVDEKGKLHGELADKSAKWRDGSLIGGTAFDLRVGHKTLKAAWEQFIELEPRLKGESDPETVGRMFKSHPDLERLLWDAVPSNMVNAVLQRRGEEVYIANWVYDYVLINDPAEAEMHLWRSLVLGRWNARGGKGQVVDDDDETSHAGRQYNQLTTKMERVMWNLAAMNDGGLLYDQFIREMMAAKDPDVFESWINKSDAIRGRQAPIVRWVDDVAEFDADKAQGGWTKNLEGSEQRLAMAALTAGAQKLVKSLGEEKTARDRNVRTLDAISKVDKHDGVPGTATRAAIPGDPSIKVTGEERELHKQLKTAIDEVENGSFGIGPAAMLNQTEGAIRAANAHSYEKGKAPAHVENTGAVEAVRDAYGHVSNYDRQMASLTSVNLDAVGNALHMVARDGGRTMDDHGRPVKWERLTTVSVVEMLKNPDTRAYARAVLYPTVMDRDPDGEIRPKLLVSKDLRSLLEGTSHKDLYPKFGTLSTDSALRYVSALEIGARKYGRSFASQRAANDIAIALSSSADHVLSEWEIKQIALRSYKILAEVVQQSSSMVLQAHPAGVDPLEEIRTAAKKTNNDLRIKHHLRINPKSKTMEIDAGLKLLMAQKEAQAEDARKEYMSTSSPVTLEDFQQQLKDLSYIQEDVERFRAKLELIKHDDIVKYVQSMFALPIDPAETPPIKSALINYVNFNMAIMSPGGTGIALLQKIFRQQTSPSFAGQYKLIERDDKNEWLELSNIVVAHYLDQVASTTAQGVGLLPFPDADHADNWRYYDRSFGYVLDDLLTESSPLVQAGRDLHQRSRQFDVVATMAQMIETLDRTIFKDYSYGEWTSDIPRVSIEANEQLDSAAAVQVISMVGTSPMTQAVISGAGKRDYTVPDAALLSTTKLSWFDLRMDDFDEVQVVHPIGPAAHTVVNRPLGQLNNRFARSVMMSYVDASGLPQELDLMEADSRVGRLFHANTQAANSGYQGIRLDRIQMAVQRAADQLGVSPTTASVSIEFFHPDMQPPNLHNNLFFEGTNFVLDADNFSSLNGGLWFADGSINPVVQQAGIDSRKKGLPALKVVATTTDVEREAIEENWTTDFAAMLRSKTETLLKADMGFGTLGPEFYNTIYKNMKMRHFVTGNDPTTGEPVLPLTAEQVIAHQLANTMPVLQNAALWVPSDDVLREMLGEQGKFGTARILNTDLGIDPTAVDPWKGITPEIAANFAPGFAGETLELHRTRVKQRARQAQLYVSGTLDDKAATAYEVKMVFFTALKSDIYEERSQLRRLEGDEGFNPRAAMNNLLGKSKDVFNAGAVPMDWLGMGFPTVSPRKTEDYVLANMMIHDQVAAMEANGSQMAWILEEGSKSNPPMGQITGVNLDHPPKNRGLMIAPGDLVNVMLDSYNGDFKKVSKHIDYLVGRGAIIMFGPLEGGGNLRAELAAYLQGEHNYTSIASSQYAFQPAVFTSRYQNQRARQSTTHEFRGVSQRNHVMNLLVLDKAMGENGAWARPGDERLNAIAVVGDIVPSDFLAGYNAPVESASNNLLDPTVSQVVLVQNQLRSLDTKAGRQMLKDMAAKKKWSPEERAKHDAEFERAWRQMIRRFDDNPGSVLPPVDSDFGTGDMIPLVDKYNNILIYRHGMKAPRRRGRLGKQNTVEQMQAQFVPNAEGNTSAANVAIFSGDSEALATTHRGTVIGWNPRSNYGLSVELDLPLQLFGDKKQLELNGMKYLITPMPGSIVLPDRGVFKNWAINLVSSLHDAISKESFDGMVVNHRNAFAYFGIDFLPDIAKFFGVEQDKAREILHAFATRAPRISSTLAKELINVGRPDRSFLGKMPEFAAILPQLADQSWITDLSAQDTPESKIALAMLVYLSTDGAEVKHVLRSGGFNDESATSNSQSLLMPQLFTQMFDNAMPGSPLRNMMFERFNDQLNNDPNNPDVGYRLTQYWEFEVRNAKATDNLRGVLQFAEAHSSGDNPIKNGMAFDEDERAPVSIHSAAILGQALNVRSANFYDIAKAQMFLEGDGVTRFTAPLPGGEVDTSDVYNMLTGIDRSSIDVGAFFKAHAPAEQEYMSRAHQALVVFRQKLDMTEENGWKAKNTADYEKLRRTIMHELGLQDSQVELVDFWVRQMIGMPKGAVRDETQEVTGDGAVLAAGEILQNVREGYMPLVATEVPLLHLSDLQLIYRVNKDKLGGWKPNMVAGDPKSKAVSWDDWTKVSLGSALTSDNRFDPLYLLALDGFMHTYQGSTLALLDLPVSMDVLKSLDLLDETNNRMLMSLDENTDLLLSDPIVLDTAHATIDELLGGKRIAGLYKGNTAPSHIVAKRREARRKWRLETGTPAPMDVSMKDFRKAGAQYANQGANTNSLIRVMINLRVGMALLNPALYVSMGPEQWVRGVLDRSANLLTGQSTAGYMARGAEAAGLSRRSSDQLTKLDTLFTTLGKRGDFKGMVYSDLNFKRPQMPGISRLERGAAAFAKAGSRAQDPTWGMSAKTLGRRYMEAVIMHIEADPLSNAISVDQLIAVMSTNPTYLKDKFPEAHEAGTNAIAQIRSLKDTVLSSTINGIVTPLSESSHTGLNAFSNVLARIPLLFSGYAMNVATSVTGLQGLDQMTAAFFHGREKGPNHFFGRIQAKMRGEELPGDADVKFDFSSVIEGIDLSRAFIRGGLTHTGLFAFGLMAGGLGLSGEDDETKKRRRMAEMQGAGFVYDPRRIENDFRNADSVFLDWLPFGLDSMFRVTGPDAPGGARSMAQLNWTLKQFISPIIGMERFFETGDFRHVTWGFEDALGSFPLINSLMWDDAVSTAHELASMAGDEAKLGSAANLPRTAWLLTNAVGIYERMLFENAFVNQIYTSFDRYDRDPYKLPLRDASTHLQGDIEGNPRPNELAFETFIDPVTHEVKKGYMGRDTASGTLHALTENRATMAFALSMFTGFSESYSRYDMVPKTRSFDKPEVSQDQAEATVRAAMQGQAVLGKGLPNLSADELAQKWKNEFRAQGVFVDWAKVDAVAAQAFAQGTDGTGDPAAMSMLDAHGVEVLTQRGAAGIMQGLVKGTMTVKSPALAGTYIPFEMRQKIQKDWMADLVQEGVNLGLDQTKATSRMKRLWYGPTEDPTTQGIGDILWSKDISFQQKINYKQLNTAYVMGPDGKPWATGFDRGSLMASLGLQPVKRALVSEQGAMSTDSRLNSVDLINGLNTGLRGLELLDDSEYVPTDVEIGKAIEDAIKETAQQPFTPFPQRASGGGGGGFRNFGRRGFTPFRRFSNGGGGFTNFGGSDFGSRPFFSKMFALPNSTSPFGNDIPFINTSNPILRRASIRRERVSSERGRLKQWQ